MKHASEKLQRPICWAFTNHHITRYLAIAYAQCITFYFISTFLKSKID